MLISYFLSILPYTMFANAQKSKEHMVRGPLRLIPPSGMNKLRFPNHEWGEGSLEMNEWMNENMKWHEGG